MTKCPKNRAEPKMRCLCSQARNNPVKQNYRSSSHTLERRFLLQSESSDTGHNGTEKEAGSLCGTSVSGWCWWWQRNGGWCDSGVTTNSSVAWWWDNNDGRWGYVDWRKSGGCNGWDIGCSSTSRDWLWSSSSGCGGSSASFLSGGRGSLSGGCGSSGGGLSSGWGGAGSRTSWNTDGDTNGTAQALSESNGLSLVGSTASSLDFTGNGADERAACADTLEVSQGTAGRADGTDGSALLYWC